MNRPCTHRFEARHPDPDVPGGWGPWQAVPGLAFPNPWQGGGPMSAAILHLAARHNMRAVAALPAHRACGANGALTDDLTWVLWRVVPLP